MSNTDTTVENTTQNTEDWAETRRWTETIVKEAVQIADDMANAGTMNRRQKPDGSTVTDIDQTVERFLRNALLQKFPNHAVLGEEFGREAKNDDPNAPLWAIDPIDGTTNLASGLPHWGISVGLVVQNAPVVGVLAFPRLNETYSACLGAGATRNGVLLPQLSPGGPTQWENTYAVCSHSARHMDFARVPARLRVFGSAALELCWVAAGKLAGAQSIGTSLYDVAAGACLAQEVGAEMGWLSGKRWSPDEMASGPIETDVLLCAPKETLRFLRENLRLPTG